MDKMHPRLPALLHPLLAEYLTLIDQRLPGFLTAFYIGGSIALDGFNERLSDIDFIAVIANRATESEIEQLRAIHATIVQHYSRWPLSGSYLQAEDLGCFEDEVQPHPFYQDGVLQPHGHFELNSVTWWTLKNRGIALRGPEPATLPFTVDWALLIAQMHENLNTYWLRWTKHPKRLLMLWSDWGIEWSVLGVLRQFHTFRENTIITKSQAGEYALTCTPARWHRVIQEALNIRAGVSPSLYRSRLRRALDAVQFLKYIIRTCNAMETGD
ncbi:MAG: DUF4111 domain-containing protein [Caldilineaceae bacterium]